MTRTLHRIRLALCFCSVGLAGCTLPQYRMVGAPTVPQSLDLAATDALLTVDVATVIIHQGPGTWKNEAWWDEYVVTITNNSAVPLTLTSIQLEDFNGRLSDPGSDPWKLERQSQSWWQTNATRNIGYTLQLGAGALAISSVAYGAALFGPASVSSAAVISTVAVAAVPVTIAGTVIVNSEGKRKIEQEFQRRRIALPRELEPKARVAGSLFFPVSPGPQRLLLKSAQGQEIREHSIALDRLSGLHFLRRSYPLQANGAPPAQPF